MFRTLLLLLVALPLHLSATEICFVAANPVTGHRLCDEGPGKDLRKSPGCSFNIALSLIGYDTGVLLDELHPEWPYQGEEVVRESWKQSQTPKTWMEQSVVWYSRRLTPRLGMETIQRYLNAFHYGNQEMTGDQGKDNGLTQAWLSSSLKISVEEQIAFLSQLVQGKLPVSPHALQMTRSLLSDGELIKGWKLFAKTGSVHECLPDGSPDLSRQILWYVGWVEQDTTTTVFALRISDTDTFLPKEERKLLVARSLSHILNR